MTSIQQTTAHISYNFSKHCFMKWSSPKLNPHTVPNTWCTHCINIQCNKGPIYYSYCRTFHKQRTLTPWSFSSVESFRTQEGTKCLTSRTNRDIYCKSPLVCRYMYSTEQPAEHPHTPYPFSSGTWAAAMKTAALILLIGLHQVLSWEEKGESFIFERQRCMVKTFPGHFTPWTQIHVTYRQIFNLGKSITI